MKNSLRNKFWYSSPFFLTGLNYWIQNNALTEKKKKLKELKTTAIFSLLVYKKLESLSYIQTVPNKAGTPDTRLLLLPKINHSKNTKYEYLYLPGLEETQNIGDRINFKNLNKETLMKVNPLNF